MLSFLLFFFLSLCLANDSGNYFSSPAPGGNAQWSVGSVQTVRWATTFNGPYNITLWQQWPGGSGADSIWAIYASGTVVTGEQDFSWTVDLRGASLSYSNKFFLWANNGGATQWTSDYFFITPKGTINPNPTTTLPPLQRTSAATTSSIATASSSTLTTSSSTASTAASPSATATTTGTSPASTAPATSSTDAAGAPSSSAVALGVGVGGGVAFALLLIAGIVGYILWRRRRKAAAASASAVAAVPTSSAQPPSPPYEYAVKQGYHWGASELAGQHVHQLNNDHKHGFPTSKPVIYEVDARRPPVEMA